MTYFVQGDGTVRVGRSMAEFERESLGPKTYGLAYIKPHDIYELRPCDDMKVPSKIYGDFEARATRIMTTFLDRPGNTGVLLTGKKGCGKTMLARMLSEKMRSINSPTIIIDQPYGGTTFNAFIGDIKEPCLVLIDEFEKIYGTEYSSLDDDGNAVSGNQSYQNSLLSLLDGTVGGRKLFVLTTNSYSTVSQFLKARPGRIFYTYEYDLLSEQFIREYCADRMNNTNWTNQVITVAEVYGGLNFDTLQALVEEVNRYNESPISCANHINLCSEDAMAAGTYDQEIFDQSGQQCRTKTESAWIDSAPTDCTTVGWVVDNRVLKGEMLKNFKDWQSQQEANGGDATRWRALYFTDFSYEPRMRCWVSSTAYDDRYNENTKQPFVMRMRKRFSSGRSSSRFEMHEEHSC